ncbi:MAG: D-alanyl-D-alanine carboxypeptidase [Clostridia bacterium]|nr:D-alanyl-D-alanine carboxypeptidase [Clostridia bacterium]
MKKLFTCILAVILLACACVIPVSAEKDAIYDIALDSRGAYVYNLETGTAIYEKAADTRMRPASTTKIMTALVVLEECADPKNTVVTVPDTKMFQYIIDDGGVHMQLSKGEEFTAYDLLLGMMMNSYCDAAELLAWHFGGESVSAFMDKMNAKAAELGLKYTHFDNPHGLDGDTHYSTPREIAYILEAASEIDLFREIISTRDYTIPATSRHKARPLSYSVGIYYPSNKRHLDCFVGGKSGFTTAAGRCLATLSEKDGVSYISVFLGANKENKTYEGNMAQIETHTLISYAYANYEIKTLLEKGTPVGTIPVEGAEVSLPVVAGETIRVLARKGSDPSYQMTLLESLTVSQVKNEAEVGVARVYFNDEETGRIYPLLLLWDGVPVTTKSPLREETENVTEAVTGIFKQDKVFLTLLILLLAVIAVCIPAIKLTQIFSRRKYHHRPKH